MTSLLDRLRHIVGPAQVLTQGDLSAYECDWRRRAHGKAMAVVRPNSAEQVAQVVVACAAAGVSIVPQGGNTGLVLGATPDDSGRQVLLSLQRMQAVRQIDTTNLSLTVEAGCILQNVQTTAAQVGLLFPLSLASQGSCTIGGNLATNAGGTQVLRYGSARDLCLGLEVVTAQGALWNGLSGLRKDNTGYDLRDLFIGSEGTLGIITAATLKLYPAPACQLTAWVAVPNLDAALALLSLARQHLSSGLTAFEIMGQLALALVQKHFPHQSVPLHHQTPWCVLLENSGGESDQEARAQLERLLELALEQACITDAVVAHSQAQAHGLWHIRECIPLAQVEEGLNIKHDISLPVSRIPAFVADTDALLQREIPGVRLVNFGHVGDGNLHYNVQAPAGVNPASFLRDYEERVNRLVFDSVAAFDGSISAEHGIGSLKVTTLAQYKSPVALGLMRAIKQALDPQAVLNPGRVIAV